MTGWFFIAGPWLGFHRDLPDGTALQVSHDGSSWVAQVVAPEIESDPRPVAGEWWEVLKMLDEAHP